MTTTQPTNGETKMTKFTDFVISADRETDVEMYQGYETKTVIIEWEGESRTIFGFDEADCVYEGKSIDECAAELRLDADEMNGLICSDVTYMDRK
jgi:hypothetical protein